MWGADPPGVDWAALAAAALAVQPGGACGGRDAGLQRHDAVPGAVLWRQGRSAPGHTESCTEGQRYGYEETLRERGGQVIDLLG